MTLTLRSRAGHAVPTGDLARRLEVTAGTGSDARSVRLGRLVEVEGARFTETADTRVPARGAREVVLDLGVAGPTIRWRVDILRLPIDGDLEGLDEAALRHRLASGRVRVGR